MTDTNQDGTQRIFIKEVQGHQARYKKLIQFTHSSTKAAGAMLLAAVVALIVANTGAYEAFIDFWHTEAGFFFGDSFAGMSLAHVINDIFMAVFFLLVGLEVKYELTVGELTNIRQALLPIMAAIGGVIAPIGIYLVFNAANPETAQGWGVPTATDIAFALGILALLGNRVPSGVRVFLSTLAVADDIIAILVIAIFYGHSPSIFWLGAAAVVLVVLVLMNRNHIYSLIPYLLVGAVLWYCVFMSGVHSTIAGVLLAFVIPSGSRVNLKGFITWSGNKVRQARDAFEPETPVIAQGAYIETVQDLSRVARQVVPPATRLEHRLYPWVYFGILPLFALTNADVSFTGMDIGAMLTDPVLYGVMLGLLLGKPLGIMLMSFAIVKSKLASLPENVNWFHMLGASILGGVGFTMAIFVANLAFTDEMHIATAKLAILAASLLAGVLGFVFLMLQAKAAQKRGVAYLSMQTDDENLQTADRDAVHDSEQMLRDIDDAEIEDFKLVKKHSGVFEIAVDLGPTGLLGGGSIGDVREAIRDEVVRVLRDEGEDELLEKVQREFEDHEGEPPLISVEEALRRSGEKERLRDALRREGQDAIGMAGGSGEDKR
ncbi:Na+/H+ antiporter NhaA [Eggerthella sinensis]|uniref:Na(+)/H(+) antiporter NhaA n=1 Tax=Eggerthella sinensis TaxID=242230 RepID=A0A3N0J0Z9_9ACTN|nr:Na+/H+ antiporter NhaA [Eggerthella sinensis]RDB68796.1 Na+/H+ antiporter NhaA [Eggerthella sinensis]RNM42928.1 Na+/H+ antiporter NhaA [Eggerthella sinensis]